jgi:hypothetical protein
MTKLIIGNSRILLKALLKANKRSLIRLKL